jgi:hypothetical protein
MKSYFVVALVFAAGMAALVWGHVDPQDSSVRWRTLMAADVSEYAMETRPAASAIAFRVSNTVQGGAIIAGLDRPVLGVFVGLNTPAAHINAPYEDLRVEFTLEDGSTHLEKPNGGGGIAMLFKSPADVPMSKLRTVTLYVDDNAAWTK